jgi:translocation and assembly module TamA
VVGGRYLAVGSVGYEHRVWGNWGAAVFSDFGNAFDRFNNSFAYSAGVGVRWRSPVGLVRIDVATGLSDPNHPVHLDLEVGPEL